MHQRLQEDWLLQASGRDAFKSVSRWRAWLQHPGKGQGVRQCWVVSVNDAKVLMAPGVLTEAERRVWVSPIAARQTVACITSCCKCLPAWH